LNSAIGLVCEGDASVSETAFSGTAKRMFLALQAKGNNVIPVNASLNGLHRAKAATVSASFDTSRWRSKFRYGNAAATLRSQSAELSLGDRDVDFMLQVGATYDPPFAESIPYAIYCDWAMALDAVEARQSNGKSRSMSVGELEKIGQKHARRYRGAAMIFTISERLRQSFIDLYGISPDKVRTAYAGPNFDLDLVDEMLARPKPNVSPAVLFIAKEFKRKGGDTVAEAFRQLLARMPDARLLFAGAEALPVEFANLKNVENLGLLDKTNPQQLHRLLSAYRESDMLVLPSRHDPFPTVIREAMFFGIPVVASNIWAMPEMVIDGETGYLIQPGDSDALCAKMTQLLTDSSLRRDIGAAARRRAEKMFSWDAVGEVLHTSIEGVLSRKEVQV
jgi:starch synthase